MAPFLLLLLGWRICILECHRQAAAGHHLQKKTTTNNHDFKELVPFCTPQLHKNSIQPSTLHPNKDLSSTSNTCKLSQVFCNTEPVSQSGVSFPVTYWWYFQKSFARLLQINYVHSFQLHIKPRQNYFFVYNIIAFTKQFIR